MPESANRRLHFFVPFSFVVYLFLSVLQILTKFQNTFTWSMLNENMHPKRFTSRFRCMLFFTPVAPA